MPIPWTALQNLATGRAAQWGGRVVGVTGSAGKTTTKDAIAHLLSTANCRSGRPVGNFNNHVGVPLSILRLPDDCRAAVLEMGMNHAGEIRATGRNRRPQIGVVTNVGYAHVEFFESIDGVAAAKRELIEEPAGGWRRRAECRRPARGPRFAEVHPGRIGHLWVFGERRCARGRSVGVRRGRSRFASAATDFETALAGPPRGHEPAGRASPWRSVFGIAPEQLRDAGARRFAAGKMRGERLEHDGITIWNDCYNSNPEAVAVHAGRACGGPPARRAIAVLGEMLELGHSAEALHRGVGRYAAERGIDVLIGIRGAARDMVDEAMRRGNVGQRRVFFRGSRRQRAISCAACGATGDAVLFKGSRGVQVERALEKASGARKRARIKRHALLPALRTALQRT